MTALAGAPAGAQDQRLPSGNAGTNQYVEPIPDAGGEVPAAPAPRRRSAGPPLAPETRAALPRGAEGRLLERVASGTGSAGRATRGPGDTSLPGRDRGLLSAVASTSGESDAPATLLLAIALAAVTAALATAALVRRRRT